MPIFALVASFRSHALSEIELLSSNASEYGRRAVDAGVSGAATLATCNRLELYVDAGSRDEARHAAATAVENGAKIALPPDAFMLLEDDEAVAHLFAVTCGLESMVPGEREISGQIRRAHQQASAVGTLSPLLDRAFQSALRTSRTVASKTGLGASGRSVVSVAVDLADATVEWEDARALVVGTGQMAELGASVICGRGAKIMGVFSPSGRTADFAEAPNIRSLDWAEFERSLTDVDVVFACSGNAGAVIDSALLEDRGTDSGALTIIDLALHGDAAPDVRDVAQVTLVNLDDVKAHAPEESVAAMSAARSIVAHATTRFAGRESSRAMDPAIVAIREHVFGLLEQEVERIRPGAGAPPEALARAEFAEHAMRRFAATVLHLPTVRARQFAESNQQEAFLEAAIAMFGIDVSSSEGACPARVEPKNVAEPASVESART